MFQEQPSDVLIALSEHGVEQIRIFADTTAQREQAIDLLSRVAPELRALETALQRRR